MGLNLANLGKRIFDQVNPLDQGRTWQHPNVVAPPQGQPAPSAFQQATHNAVTNFVGQNVVEPVVRAPINIANTLYNRAVAPVINTPNLTPTQVSPLSGVSRQLGATGSLHQTLGDTAQLALTLGSGGLANLTEKGGAGVAGFVAPKLATRAAVLTSKGLSTQAIPKVVNLAIGANAGGVIGSGFNAAAAAGQGANLKQTAESAGIGYGLGAGLPVAGAAVKPVVKLATNAVPEVKPVYAYQEPKSSVVGKNVKPNVSVPKVRLAADPELQSLYDTAAKSQNLSPIEQLHAEDAVRNHMNQRNIEAEQAALNHLQTGGNRDEAVNIYAKTAGVSQKMASRRVVQAAKEAKQSLRPNESGTNPELSNFESSPIAAGDYATGKSRYKIVNNLADFHQEQSLKALDKLSPTDRGDFVHYVQGTKDIATAENPQSVQVAVDTFRKGADTIHALDTQFAGGKTRYIKNFFPDYWDTPANQALLQHKAEQQLEEQMGPDVWNNLTSDERAQALGEFQQHTALDTGNYQGFRNQGRLFANRQEGLNAGFQPRFADPAEDIKNYFISAKLKVAPQALINATRKADVNSATLGNTIDLPGKTSFETSDAGHQVLKGLARKKLSKSDIYWKPYDTVSGAATQAIVLNPIFHGSNQLLQGFVASGRSLGLKAGPGGGLTFLKNSLNMSAKDTVEYSRRFLEDGGHYPSYGKNSQGILAKASGGATNVNRAMMASIEARLRTSTYKTLVDSGMDGKEAVKAIDHYLGGGDAFSSGVHRGTIFLHYFKTMVGALAGHAIHPIENAGATANLIIGAAAIYGASKAFQEITGNPNANVRAPGELGLAKEIINSGKDIKEGRYRQSLGVLTNRINPVAKEAGQQLFNQDLFTGNSLDESGGRLSHAVNSLIAPLQQGGKVASGKKSVPELIANQLQLNTPHAKTNPAAPKVAFLNNKTVTVNGQKVPVSIAQGNDPTGYQQQQAYYKTTENSQKGLTPADKKKLDGILASETDPNGVKIGANDKQAMAKNADLYSHPDLLKRITQQKQEYAQITGQKLDPLYDNKQLTEDQRLAYIRLQSLPYKSDEWQHTYNANKDWIRPLDKARSDYFNSLPPSAAPPSQRVLPPNFPDSTNTLLDQVDKLTGSNKGQFIADHPELQDAYSQLSKYTADRIAAQGGAPRDVFPTTTPQEAAIIKTYNAIPKGGGAKGGNAYRSAWIKANPQAYAVMTNFFTRASLYGLQNAASQAQFKDTGFTSKGLGDIYNIGKYDIAKGKDTSGNPVYALTTGQSGGGPSYVDQNGNTFANLGSGSGGSGSGYKSRVASKAANPYAYAAHTGNDSAKYKKVSVKKSTLKKATVATKGGGKPRVSMRKSMV